MVPFTRLPRSYPAAHLVVHDQRVDDAAAVGDRPMAEELDETGGRIEFEIGAVRAVAHVIARGVRHMAARDRELHVGVGRQRVLAEISDLRHFGLATCAPVRVLTICPRTMSRSSGDVWVIAPATVRTLRTSARAALSTASPPMAIPRDAQAPPP
jgi:hypothetical protein